MKTKKVANEMIEDVDNPEWTAEDFKKAVPFYEIFPQLKPVASKKADKPKKPIHQQLHAA